MTNARFQSLGLL